VYHRYRGPTPPVGVRKALHLWVFFNSTVIFCVGITHYLPLEFALVGVPSLIMVLMYAWAALAQTGWEWCGKTCSVMLRLFWNDLRNKG
jgi:hypothetical protein